MTLPELLDERDRLLSLLLEVQKLIDAAYASEPREKVAGGPLVPIETEE